MIPPITLCLADCIVTIGPQHVVTDMPDGTCCEGAPEDNDAYRATAERLGYGGDVARMNRSHETAHSLVAMLLGLPASPTLWRVAHGQLEASDLTGIEEDAVCSLERLANRMGVDLVERAEWLERRG